MRPKQVVAAVVLLIVVITFSIQAAHPIQQAGKKAGDKPKPHFTISKETTYVTGPLDKDGYVDYAAALNARLSQGVTPANNANVLLSKAIGPMAEGKPMPPEFFKLMGMEPPTAKGEYFIDLYTFLRERLKVDTNKESEKIDKEEEFTQSRAWKAEQYPN